MKDADVIVVGGGIVGAACARELALEGEAVILLDARPPGSGATAAGMGHLITLDGSEAELALTASSVRAWNELVEALPDAVEYRRTGTLWVAATEEEMADARTRADALNASGVTVETLPAAEVARREPNLCRDLVGGIFLPGDGVIYAPAAARWMAARAEQAGARRPALGAVRRIVAGGVELADGSELSADHVVCAAGEASLGLLAEPVPGASITKKKGHLAITARYPGFVTAQILELGYMASAHGADDVSVAFNVQPRATGQILIGSSRQHGVGSSEVEPAVLTRMLERAFTYMPRLRELRCVRTWTGHRATTRDGLPLVGPHPALDGVILAAGHEGLGITTATATADLVASLVVPGRTARIAAAPYRADRFAEAAA